MWTADSVLSLVIALYLPFVLVTQQEVTNLSFITALQLFPLMAPIVASAVGSNVADLPDELAVATIVTSYILWELGVPGTMITMCMYYQRLALRKLPPRDVIVSVFMPLGPPSLGGYTLIQLGKVAIQVFPKTKTLPKWLVSFFTASE
jgi:tellurite resistance protein TehA-like permease